MVDIAQDANVTLLAQRMGAQTPNFDVAQTRTDTQKQQALDNIGSDIVLTRDILAGLNPADYTRVRVVDHYSEFYFRYRTGNFTAEVTADTGRAIYVPTTADPTGAAGCWILDFTGPAYPEWSENFNFDYTQANHQPVNQLLKTLGTGAYVGFQSDRTYMLGNRILMDQAWQVLELGTNTILEIDAASPAGRAVLITAGQCSVLGTGPNSRIECANLGSAITSSGASRSTIRDIYVRDADIRAISLSNSGGHILERIRIEWTAAGAASVVTAAPGAIYGITLFTSQDGGGVQAFDIQVSNCYIDMTRFTPANIPDLSQGAVIRGDEDLGTGFVRRLRFENNTILLPADDRTNYGTPSLKRPTCVEIRTNIVDSKITGNHCEGGDLALSFGNLTRCTVSKNTCLNATTYGIEIALESEDSDFDENQIDCPNALYPVAITTSENINYRGGRIRGGYDAGGAATGNDRCALIWIQASGPLRSDRVNISGVRLYSTNPNADIIRASSADEITIRDCSIRGINTNTNGIHFFNGTSTRLTLSGNVIEGILGGSALLVAPGTTIDKIHAVGNSATAGGYTNSGTVTATVIAGNDGLGTLD